MYQWGVSTGALDRRCTLNGLRSSVNRATGKLVWDATSQRTVSFAQVGSASKKLKEGEDASSGAKVEDQYLTLKLVRGVTEAGSLQFGADDLQDQVLKMPGKTLEDHVGVLFAANGRPGDEKNYKCSILKDKTLFSVESSELVDGYQVVYLTLRGG